LSLNRKPMLEQLKATKLYGKRDKTKRSCLILLIISPGAT
jgi:hypothetical protein